MGENSTAKRDSSQQSFKVPAISGSLRTASISTSILRCLSEQKHSGGALSVRTLKDIPLYNEDLDTEPAPASVAMLRDEIRSSDGVVIATPEYNHRIPGILKNALDWASRPAFASCFRNKPVLTITSAPGSTGGVRAQYQPRETLASMLANVVPGREILLAGVESHLVEGRLRDANTVRVLARGIQTLREEIMLRRTRGGRFLRSRLRHGMVGVLLAFAAARPRLDAQQHPPQPSVNLGDTSFLDALGAPGVLFEEIGDASHSGLKVNGMGQTVSEAPAVNSISGLTHGVGLTKHRLLGAWWGFETIVAAAHVNAGSAGVAGGFGDLTVSPLVLQWKALKIGPSQLNQRFVLDFELPVGEYRQDTPVSLSGHAFTVHPYYAFTFFPVKQIETSWRAHYLYNGVNNDPSVGNQARSSQAGQAVHFNATVAYRLPHELWVGANGYLLEQITAAQINDAVVPASPERVGAIGPGMVWDRGQYLFYVNGYHEVGALNRPQGNKLILRVQWVPGRHAGIDGPH